MPRWTPFPHDAQAYLYNPTDLKKQWARLHAGDAEPWPSSKDVQEAWAHFHAGDFEGAVDLGLQAGGSGLHAANKAQCIYATYLERSEKNRLALFQEVAQRCEERLAQHPDDVNAHYFLAYALGRYSQGISVTKALAQGLGSKIKHALEKAIDLQPLHADAQIALGAFHAEVIDKVGALLGRAQGASKDAGIKAYKTALKINPQSAIALIEYANGLVMLEGEKRLEEATALYEKAAAHIPMDAMEHLDVELAKSSLEEDED